MSVLLGVGLVVLAVCCAVGAFVVSTAVYAWIEGGER